MIGTKLYKGRFTDEQYIECAMYCNEVQFATIEDKGDYYEVVEIPAPSLDELKTAKIEEFKTQRNAEEVLPIEWNGNL